MVLTAKRTPPDAGLHCPMQSSLFEDTDLSCAPITRDFQPLDERSSVLFEPGWVRGSGSAFEQLRDQMPWRALERPMYDRIVDVPRLICTVRPSSLESDHPLRLITTALEKGLSREFSSVGLNYYRDGRDSVAWHRDRIGRTGRPAVVALVSLGSPRTLSLRRHADHPSKTAETTGRTSATRLRWTLGHGDLLVMAGACQREWEHCVPKERGVGPRISLAFRCQEGVEGPRLTDAGVPPLWASHKLQ